MRRLIAWAEEEASTRTAGLMRVATPLLLWDRWGGEMLLYRPDTAARLALAIAFFVFTALAFAGLFTRFATAGLAATMLWMFFGFGVLGGVDDWVHHHCALLVDLAVLLALTPAGRSLSVDRWWRLRRGVAAPERGPRWALRLVALQVSVVYAFAAYDKTTLGFLSGERLQAILLDRYGGMDPPGAWFTGVCLVAAVATLAIESALAVGLWWDRARPWLLLGGIVLHGLFYVLLPVGPFSLTILVMYLAFWHPDDVHRGMDRLLAPLGADAP